MKALFLSMFSMRRYTDGKYSVLKDGNFQLSIARAYASDFEEVRIALPHDACDIEETLEKFKVEIDSGKFVFIPFTYGVNAANTREVFWGTNWCAIWFAQKGCDVLITDITGYPGTLPVIYNFNITKLPELDRPYIDKFFETDLWSIEHSLFTTVLNPRQKEYIVEVRPDLADKVLVHTKCAHENLLPISGDVEELPSKMIFWPFRLSDKAYKWDEFKEAFESSIYKGYTVVITDPNETSGDLPPYVVKIKPTKEEYYKILQSKPIVVMLDDIDTVLHPGTIEFFHYGCPVIAFNAALIGNKNSITDLNQLSMALSNVVYNRTSMHSFVYSKDEVDSYLNERFIHGR